MKMPRIERSQRRSLRRPEYDGIAIFRLRPDTGCDRKQADEAVDVVGPKRAAHTAIRERRIAKDKLALIAAIEFRNRVGQWRFIELEARRLPGKEALDLVG